MTAHGSVFRVEIICFNAQANTRTRGDRQTETLYSTIALHITIQKLATEMSRVESSRVPGGKLAYHISSS